MNEKLNRYLSQDLTWGEIAKLLDLTIGETKQLDIFTFKFKGEIYDRIELRNLLKNGFEDYLGVQHPEIFNPQITVLSNREEIETNNWNTARNGVEYYLNEFKI